MICLNFRFFIKWIACCLGRLQYDIENLPDLYDPLRCPSKLLWMLADTMGYKYVIQRVNAADYGVPQRRKRVFVIA